MVRGLSSSLQRRRKQTGTLRGVMLPFSMDGHLDLAADTRVHWWSLTPDECLEDKAGEQEQPGVLARVHGRQRELLSALWRAVLQARLVLVADIDVISSVASLRRRLQFNGFLSHGSHGCTSLKRISGFAAAALSSIGGKSPDGGIRSGRCEISSIPSVPFIQLNMALWSAVCPTGPHLSMRLSCALRRIWWSWSLQVHHLQFRGNGGLMSCYMEKHTGSFGWSISLTCLPGASTKSTWHTRTVGESYQKWYYR